MLHAYIILYMSAFDGFLFEIDYPFKSLGSAAHS